MDAVANCITSAFLISNGMRRDTEVILLLLSDPTRVLRVRLDSLRLKYLNPDERSTAALLKNAINRYWGSPERRDTPMEPSRELETTPGIFVRGGDLVRDLTEFAGGHDAIWLTESGGDFGPNPGPEGISAILSDPYEPSEEEKALLRSLSLRQVSLGPVSLHTSHCITIVHHRLDSVAKAYQKDRPIVPTSD
jgi:tRNA (pseudouridine54-N1)-methyltransferase